MGGGCEMRFGLMSEIEPGDTGTDYNKINGLFHFIIRGIYF